MKFVAISDTHGKHAQLKLPAGDVLLHAGDISYKGKKTEVLEFLGWFSSLPYKHKIFIGGNHDFFFEKEKLANILSLVPLGVTYLQDSEIVLDGIRIWGSPVTPYFFNWAFNRKRGAAIRKHWDQIPAGVDIILTHGPVYSLLDMVKNRNTGDVDLLHTIEALQPKFHVCGHIHEGYGKIKRGSTQFINASVLNELYELVNRPVVFEI